MHELAASGLLKLLTHSELIVYVNVLSFAQFHREVCVSNARLHDDTRTATRCLRSLESFGLLKVQQRVPGARDGRTIEVLR